MTVSLEQQELALTMANLKGKIMFGVLCVLLTYVVALYATTGFSAGPGEKQTVSKWASWRPRKEAKGIRFAGSNACGECHTAISKAQHGTAMAKGLELPPG